MGLVSLPDLPSVIFFTMQKHLLFSLLTLLPGIATAAGLPPAGVVVKVVSPEETEVIWADSNPNESGFLIERRRSGKENFEKAGQTRANETKFADKGVKQKSKYYYRISAILPGGNSPFSELVEVSMPEAGPVAPSNLLALVVSGKQVQVMWTDNANNEAGFDLERKIGVKGVYAKIETLSCDQTSFRDPIPGPGTYVYRVKASNGGGASAYSKEYGVVIKSDEKKRVSPYVLVSGYNNILNLQITGTSGNWVMNDVAPHKLDPGYEWWYFLGGKSVKTASNLKDEPWKGNQPGRVIKMAGKVGLGTFNKWEPDPQRAGSGGYYDTKAGQTLEDNSIGGVTTFIFK